ncbi:hypothetical protein JW592_19020 [Streptomyces sp. DW4-2]|uniref:TetR family transcriptional regulator n=1 Tax=Streptomyces spirodelae TaxID=2812904 RepID=A0ABS3WXJ1_9ACTN|nr:hypothetical protein [Streptomyces spirodelae]
MAPLARAGPPDGRRAHPRFVLATVESLTHRFMGRDPHFDATDLTAQIVTMTLAYLHTSGTLR